MFVRLLDNYSYLSVSSIFVSLYVSYVHIHAHILMATYILKDISVLFFILKTLINSIINLSIALSHSFEAIRHCVVDKLNALLFEMNIFCCLEF